MVFENIVKIGVQWYLILTYNPYDSGKPFMVLLPDVDAFVAPACHGMAIEKTLAITHIGCPLEDLPVFGQL